MTDQPYTGPEIEAAVRILREDAQLAHNRALMARLDAMEERLGRMPVQELSAEEKAAAYDRMMAEQKNGGATPPKPGTGGTDGGPPAPGKGDDGGKPPAPPAKPPTPPADTTRKTWWDGYQQQGG